MQQLNPSEISDLIRQRIDQLDVSSEARNEGTIVSVMDGIIRIHGLTDVMYGEMIEFDGGIYGMALNLERDSVGAVILGDYKGLAEGEWVPLHRPHPRGAGGSGAAGSRRRRAR
jgi:F-type H+-transporting ATPase subunit alpha